MFSINLSIKSSDTKDPLSIIDFISIPKAVSLFISSLNKSPVEIFK